MPSQIVESGLTTFDFRLPPHPYSSQFGSPHDFNVPIIWIKNYLESGWKMYQKSIKKLTKKVEEIHQKNDQNFQKCRSKKPEKKTRFWKKKAFFLKKNPKIGNYLMNYSQIGNVWNEKCVQCLKTFGKKHWFFPPKK